MSVLEKINQIKSKCVERDALLDQLRLWAEVQEQGLNPEDVHSFLFEPCFLSLKQKRDRMQAAMFRKPDIWVTPKGETLMFNAVRLKNDVILKLNPPLKRA